VLNTPMESGLAQSYDRLAELLASTPAGRGARGGDDRGVIAHFPSAFVFHRFQARLTSPGSLFVMMSPSSGAR
jgi:hypothetical protein